MNYHDYHLQGYDVADFGRRIVVHLAWDYPGPARAPSNIEFTGVVLYHFVHSAGAIITDIEAVPVGEFIEEFADSLQEWAEWYGLTGWTGTPAAYQQFLEQSAKTVWQIESAVGFYGVVVADRVRQLDDSGG
jgi:hypothetical protein